MKRTGRPSSASLDLQRRHRIHPARKPAGLLQLEFDTRLQAPFMIAFFTCIGLGASPGLLRIGGSQVLLFWLLASVLAVLQNALGVGGSPSCSTSHPFLGSPPGPSR